MNAVIASASAPGFQAAADANLVAFWAGYGRAEGCVFERSAGVAWFYTGVPYTMFNGVVNVAADAAIVEAHARLKALIAERGAPAIWWIAPDLSRESICAQLESLGLAPFGTMPAMALDLELLEETPAPPGFSVKIVDDAATHAQWARTAAVGTGLSEAAADAMVKLEPALGEEIRRTQPRYLGLLDGEPVTTSALVCDAGLAGIYAVSTLPHARGKGLGRAMTARPLADARARGYRIGVLQASPMGRPVYARMGFRDVWDYRLYAQR